MSVEGYVISVLLTLFTGVVLLDIGRFRSKKDKERDIMQDKNKELLEKLIKGMDAMMDGIKVIGIAVKNKNVNGNMDKALEKIEKSQAELNGVVVDKALC